MNEIYERSFYRYPNKGSYCFERESSPGHDMYKGLTGKEHQDTILPEITGLQTKDLTGKDQARHYGTNKRSRITPSRPHRHQESNNHSSSEYLSRTVKSNCSARYKSRHRNHKHVKSSRRHHSPKTSSSSDDEDSSSSSSIYSSDNSDSLSESSSSDESAYSFSDKSLPERHRHSTSSSNHKKCKQIGVVIKILINLITDKTNVCLKGIVIAKVRVLDINIDRGHFL